MSLPSSSSTSTCLCLVALYTKFNEKVCGLLLSCPTQADDTRPLKVGRCLPTKVGQYLSADILYHTSDFYRPVFRLHMTATWQIREIGLYWSDFNACFFIIMVEYFIMVTITPLCIAITLAILWNFIYNENNKYTNAALPDMQFVLDFINCSVPVFNVSFIVYSRICLIRR